MKKRRIEGLPSDPDSPRSPALSYNSNGLKMKRYIDEQRLKELSRPREKKQPNPNAVPPRNREEQRRKRELLENKKKVLAKFNFADFVDRDND